MQIKVKKKKKINKLIKLNKKKKILAKYFIGI